MKATSVSNYPHWNVAMTVFFTVVILIASLLAPVVLAWVIGAIASDTLDWSNVDSGMRQLLAGGDLLAISVLIGAAICIPLLVLFIKMKKGTNLSVYLAFRSVPVKTYLFWGAITLFIAIVGEYIVVWFGADRIPEFMIDTYANTGHLWLLFLAVVIAAPVWEELLFRGFLMRGLESSFVTRIGAVVITAAVWALIHFQYEWQYLLLVFIMGLALGCARLATASIFVPISMHVLNNSLALGQLALLNDSY